MNTTTCDLRPHIGEADALDKFRALLNERMTWANSYSRMPNLIDAIPDRTQPADFWKLWFSTLGYEWSCCDNIGASVKTLVRVFKAKRDFWKYMMTPEAAATLAGLPDPVVAYRGCGPSNKFGLSWSLSAEVASRFPFLDRYRQTAPRLITARIPRDRIVAVILDRGERELIALVNARDVTSNLPLTMPAAMGGKP